MSNYIIQTRNREAPIKEYNYEEFFIENEQWGNFNKNVLSYTHIHTQQYYIIITYIYCIIILFY